MWITLSSSQGSVVVDSELIFRNSSVVPDTAAVVNALVEAASNNSNFSIPVNVSTIAATCKSCFIWSWISTA